MILFIKHIEIEGPEILGAFFVEKGYQPAVVNLHAGESLPDSLDGLDAVVSLGGPMNVYEEDKYPFLKDEDLFLKQVLERQIPFLGICLGSQLLSKASGGKVIKSPRPEIGWFKAVLTQEGQGDPVFRCFPMEFQVFQWHGDMCVPPEGAVTLAASERCPMQAFRVGRNAYGLQFHAEITDKSIDEWSREYAPKKHAEREAMLRQYSRIQKEFVHYGRLLCENFLGVLKGQ